MIIAAALAVFYLSFVYQIPVDHVDAESQIPQGLLTNPVFAAVAANTTGDVSLSLQNFNYTSPDGSTKLSASSANVQITITPTGQSSRVDMTVQLSGANVKSPSFTGAFSSLKLTGYVVVDPQTNKLIVSVVASTSVAGILEAVLGV